MAIKNAKVDEVFQPSINGFLGEGANGLVYKGSITDYIEDYYLKNINNINLIVINRHIERNGSSNEIYNI